MARPLNVLFLSSEVEPFAKTGGLADVSGSLPQTIKHFDHEIRIMMPCYGSINQRTAKLHEMIRLKDVPVPVGDRTYLATVKSSIITNNGSKLQIYFIGNQELFSRPGLYVDPTTQQDYNDNDERFIFFCRGVLEVLKIMGWQPDIIHCNDWQTGLVPVYLKTTYRGDPFYKDTKTVFTIHNMAYQGVFPISTFPKTSLPMEMLSENGIVAYGNLNMMKSGLMFADALTTVSERYAKEIQCSSEFGYGLQDVVSMRKKDLVGIINGIDYSVWNPAVDEIIPHRYDSKTVDVKLENKKELLASVGLPFNESTPLIGIISRLADQKGFDLIGVILGQMMKMDLQLVILGTGERRYHDMLERARHTFPERIAIHLAFNNELAHLIEAGSDMFLMPSRYEPCGLNQLYSLKYGTVPIVRATGGLDDTIEQVDPSTGSGTGFKFTKYDSGELLSTIQGALQLFKDHTLWRKVVKNGMGKDFSWESSAKKYIHLYRSVLRA